MLTEQDQGIDELDDDIIPKQEVTWNEDQEKEFQFCKAIGKTIYNNYKKTANFTDLALSPWILSYNLKEKNKIQRKYYLDKYAEGEQLTAKQMKFLAETSSLLNSYVDKHYLQECVNAIDNEDKQRVNLVPNFTLIDFLDRAEFSGECIIRLWWRKRPICSG